MTDNEQDGDLTTGTTEKPTQPDSKGKSELDSFDAAKLQSQLEASLQRMEKIESAYTTWQSGKDKNANAAQKFNDEVAELKRKIAEIEKLKKSGLDDDTAVEEFSFREDVRALRDQLSRLNQGSQTPPAGNVVNVTEAAQKVLAKAGVSANDPEVSKLIAENSDPVDLAMKLGEHKTRLANKPSSSVADISPMTGGETQPPPDQQVLEAKAVELRNLYKSPSLNKAKIAKLEKELEDFLPK